jgi:pantoate--beta-alanine ligase
MEIIRIPRIIQDTCQTAAMRGKHVGLVPTMGALHEGHMSLVRMSMQENDMTVASIFINPAQFGEGEDLENYPRDLDGDIGKLRDAGVDVLFMPEAGTMYPEGFDTTVEAAGLSSKLCGAFRPGHFRGVATVVAKLLNIVRPKRAYFGLKDYQQCLVIKRLAQDLNMPVEVVTCPTVREPDGLAMSSRNQHLSPGERKAAALIYKALSEAARMLQKKGATAEEATRHITNAFSTEPLITGIDYSGVYDPETLDELKGKCPFNENERECSALLAAAVRIGSARLIDNVIL